MNLQDYFREHQMIRMTVVLSIITIGFISAIFGLSMLMQVHGQTETPYSNCIYMKMDEFIQIATDEDCNEKQFSEAVTYYKTNGYPIESTIINDIQGKFLELLTNDYAKSEGLPK